MDFLSIKQDDNVVGIHAIGTFLCIQLKFIFSKCIEAEVKVGEKL